jgi:hypothetical protein
MDYCFLCFFRLLPCFAFTIFCNHLRFTMGCHDSPQLIQLIASSSWWHAVLLLHHFLWLPTYRDDMPCLASTDFSDRLLLATFDGYHRRISNPITYFFSPKFKEDFFWPFWIDWPWQTATLLLLIGVRV